MEDRLLQAGIVTPQSGRILEDYLRLIRSIVVNIKVHSLPTEELCAELKISRTTFFERLREENWNYEEAVCFYNYLSNRHQPAKAKSKSVKKARPGKGKG